MRQCIFWILQFPISHIFRFLRSDSLPIIFLFGDFWCRRRKLQLYLAVKCGKPRFQQLQLVLLLPHLARDLKFHINQ